MQGKASSATPSVPVWVWLEPTGSGSWLVRCSFEPRFEVVGGHELPRLDLPLPSDPGTLLGWYQGSKYGALELARGHHPTRREVELWHLWIEESGVEWIQLSSESLPDWDSVQVALPDGQDWCESVAREIAGYVKAELGPGATETVLRNLNDKILARERRKASIGVNPKVKPKNRPQQSPPRIRVVRGGHTESNRRRH